MARERKKKTYRGKLFMNGGSQAVRLPKECRLPGKEVAVKMEGRRVILEPLVRDWSPRLVELLRNPPADLRFEREQPERAQREDISF